jgi:isoleucyl-tRNA synthetase
MRKDADFNIADHITVRYAASEKIGKAIQQFAEYIRGETLATTLETGDADDGFHHEAFNLDGETLTLGVKRV